MSGEATVPGFYRKREMLQGNRASKEELGKVGRSLAGQGILDEALLFFVKAEDEEGMADILEESRRQGDAFTFDAALQALGRTASRSEWSDVGEKAAAAGMFRFASRAFEKAGDKDGVERMHLALAAEENLPNP